MPEIPDVPSIFDYAKTAEQRQLMRFVFSSTEFGRPYVFPPGVPKDRVEAMRDALAAAVKDPSCRYIACLNTDARLAADWLETLVSFAEEHQEGAGFQTLTLDYYDHNRVDSRGILINRQGQAVQVGYGEPRSDWPTSPVFGVNAAAAL